MEGNENELKCSRNGGRKGGEVIERSEGEEVLNSLGKRERGRVRQEEKWRVFTGLIYTEFWM